jgi:hypothetical protein
MASKSITLTDEEFASLLTVGNAPVHGSAPAIPDAHSAQLIALGYMADIAGRLRMTTPGRFRDGSGYMLGRSALEATSTTPAAKRDRSCSSDIFVRPRIPQSIQGLLSASFAARKSHIRPLEPSAPHYSWASRDLTRLAVAQIATTVIHSITTDLRLFRPLN